ncbi:MAG: hypothetical protein OEX02_15670 [Cyclobacteriaceae bacterium]|nr:hypothetical protein [Cyclobacteriaceae bacterium]
MTTEDNEDQLERFIKKNREHLDEKEPPVTVWKNIERRIGLSRGRYMFLWKAAAILFFTTSVALYSQKTDSNKSDETQTTVAVSGDFSHVEAFYFDMIDEKKEMLVSFTGKELALSPEAIQDLYKLDAMYKLLKEELVDNPSEKVVDALILNLLIRVDILNKELKEKDHKSGVGNASPA